MTIKQSVSGIYGNCKYEFILKASDNQVDELKKNSIGLIQNHLTLINYIQNPITGLILGDGIFTKIPNLKMFIQTKDCIPLIVLGNGFCGGVHISWKNLYLGIYNNMFKLFNKENIHISDLQFIIGPHITQESMEYNEESMWKNHPYYDKAAFIHSNGKNFFSMEYILMKVLTENGIKKEQILSTGINTYRNENYASYRRDGKNNSLTNIFTIIREEKIY